MIPARGGSKGIPLKNLRTVAGAPIVVRAVRAASAAGTVDLVVVSTDDDRIAEASSSAGAHVVRRPAELSGDAASSESAVLHALDSLAGPDPEVVLLVQCTSPFTTPADVDGTVAALERENADCAFTAALTHRFLWRRDSSGAASGVNHDPAVRLPRQQLEPEYVETGAVYAMRTAGFRATQHRFFGRIVMHEVQSWRALEIDEPEDLAVADALAARRELPAQVVLPDPTRAVVLDFDGVLTDDRVVTLEDGREAVVASRSDGLGIERLRRAGIPVLVLSKERNPVVAARAAKLRVECLQGIDDKLAALRSWADAEGISMASIVYVGNDVNDRDCLDAVGCGVIPADAHADVRDSTRLVLQRRGGRGAVRELADMILFAKGAH